MKLKLFVLFSIIIGLLCGCKSDITQISQTGYFFDTAITIKLYESGKKPLLKKAAPDKYKKMTSEEILAECFETCAFYEQIFSRTMEGSDVWNINHSKGAVVEIEPETMRLITDCLSLGKKTGGVFDITISPIADKWGFSSANLTEGHKNVPPEPEVISNLLTHVDYNLIQIIDERHIKLTDPDAAIDLGASAKGYIADKLKEKLMAMGVENGIIDLGGNILCIGNKPDGADFTLGIERPFEGSLMTSIKSADKSLVTSGIYHRYYEYEGKLYHHLLNTNTGYPEDNNLYSVTILGDSSQWADMYSTACFLLGEEKGLDLAENTPDIEALFITKDYEIITTSGWPDSETTVTAANK